MSFFSVVAATFGIVYCTQNTPRTLLTDAVNSMGAMCMDGTPGAYFFSHGTEANKWVIYFEGGGWCGCLTKSCSTGFDTCYARSSSYLGSSSTQYSQNTNTLDLDVYPSGQLNSVQAVNPMMYNWNHVFVHYCDGGSFGGNLQQPIIYANKKIYYRGFRILNALFQELTSKHGLGSATDFVISGGSAGGLTTYLHTNYITDTYLSNVPNVFSMPDCGFFLDSNGVNGATNYSNAMKWVYSAMNITTDIRCVTDMKKNNRNKNLCIFAPNVAPYITVPLYALQSQYDMWQIPNILGSTQAAYIDWYAQNLTAQVEAYVLGTRVAQSYNGAFLVSCYSHCGLWDTVHIDAILEDESFTDFYQKSKKQTFYYQNDSYPCEACCS